MREEIRAKLEELKRIRNNLHGNDFLLTWGQSEADLRAVLMTAEILEQFYQANLEPCVLHQSRDRSYRVGNTVPVCELVHRC